MPKKPIKIAINGYGRIGRQVVRAIYELNRQHEFSIVGINATGPVETTVHLTQYDSVHGTFNQPVTVVDEHTMAVAGNPIPLFSTRDPSCLSWGDLDVDVVMECTGQFRSREEANIHCERGAKKVLISAPGKNVDATIVYGVNHQQLNGQQTIVSNASCTTNCLAPVAKPLHDALGISKGLMTTIHAATNDQKILDARHNDLRRARAAFASMIPTKTGAAAAVGLVIPELNGKLDGFAVRVPTMNVSVVDLTLVVERETTVNEVNDIMKAASQGTLKGVLAYNDAPLVSIDFNHHSASAIFDGTQTRVMGNLVKIMAWYDNEWGFSCRMLDVAKAMIDG